MMKQDTQLFERPIPGVEVLDLPLTEKDYPFLLIDDILEQGSIWLAPQKTFSPLLNLEFDLYLMVFFIVLPFTLLGFTNGLLFGMIGLGLLLAFAFLSIHKFRVLYRQHLSQKMDTQKIKKGMVFTDHTVYVNNGQRRLKIDLDALEHIRFYKKKNVSLIEFVASGKVVIEIEDHLDRSIDAVQPLLQQHFVKLI